MRARPAPRIRRCAGHANSGPQHTSEVQVVRKTASPDSNTVVKCKTVRSRNYYKMLLVCTLPSSECSNSPFAVGSATVLRRFRRLESSNNRHTAGLSSHSLPMQAPLASGQPVGASLFPIVGFKKACMTASVSATDTDVLPEHHSLSQVTDCSAHHTGHMWRALYTGCQLVSCGRFGFSDSYRSLPSSADANTPLVTPLIAAAACG